MVSGGGGDMATDAAAVWVRLDELHPWDGNPRLDQPVDDVARSIKRFGFAAPILARLGCGEIIAGHTRYKAAQKLGLETVPVRWMDLSDSEARALALADNRLTEAASWDDVALRTELRSLELVGLDLGGLGFTADELMCLLRPEIDEDEAFGALPDTDGPAVHTMTLTLQPVQFEVLSRAIERTGLSKMAAAVVVLAEAFLEQDDG